MKERIHNYFEQYKENYTKWSELERGLMKSSAKEEWMNDFASAMSSFQSIYDANTDLVTKIENESQELNYETAVLFYDEIMLMYMEDYNDAELLIRLGKRLIPVFEGAKDYSRLVMVYSMIQNYYYDIDNPGGKKTEFDYSYTTKGMELIKYYKELDESARYRVWIMYYNYIVRLSSAEVVSINDALDKYDEIMEFAKRPDIIELDKNNEKVQSIIAYIDQTLMVCTGKMAMVDIDIRKRFYKYSKKFFENNPSCTDNLYELPNEVFSAYLFNGYMEGQYAFDEFFAKYLDYFKYKFRVLMIQSDLENDDIIQCNNAILYLSRLGKHVEDKALVDDALSELIELAETRKIRSNLTKYDRMSDIMANICQALNEYDIVGVDKEKTVCQLICQRDINVYIHSKITSNISYMLYRELTLKKPEFFKNVKSVSADGWKNYVYYGSMFHDIGLTRVLGMFSCKFRPLFPVEVEREKSHAKFGAAELSHVETLKKYAPVIMGHHVYYNGENSKEYGYDRNEHDVSCFVDIVALAVYIEKATDRFGDFNHTSKHFKSVLSDIKAQSGRRFNPEIVDVILQNEILQRQIERIVYDNREDTLFEVYHNWEKIQLSQDEESMLDDCLHAFNRYRENHDEGAFSIYLNHAMHLADHAEKDRTVGKAKYILAVYLMIKGEYNEAKSLYSDIERLLKNVHDNETLAAFYYNAGSVELLQDNIERSLSYFLNCVSVAEKTPGCEINLNRGLTSIASIFLSKNHFIKAKEYFDRCILEFFEIDEEIRFWCLKGYCLARLGFVDEVKKIKEKVSSLMEENAEYIVFPQYIYLAQMASSAGDDNELKDYLAIVREMTFTEEDIIYYSDEMFMHIELLVKRGMLKEASEVLDRYIELCEGNNDYNTVLMRLLNIKIEVMANLQGQLDFIRYEGMLKKVYYISLEDDVKRIESTEAALLEEIKLREEHEKIKDSTEILEESVKKAKSDSEQKSQFLSSMSHEIRTPINAILGLNEMIIRESEEEAILQYASDIQNAGKQLLGIINDVLDYSKIEAGKMEIVPQPYDVSTMISDIKNMIGPKLDEKNLEFRVTCDEDMPNKLYGDDFRIKQILLNLLSNAYKYTKEGFVEFNISYTKVDDKSIKLRLCVRDTGMGLKKEQIEKLATPFERFDLVNNRGVEGTGLGMSIVTKLLEQMDSHLLIESEYGKGSSFTFELTQGVIEWRKVGRFDDGRKAFVRSSTREQAVKKGSLRAPKAKILIVDDNAVNLKVAAALLKRTEMQIDTVTSGAECLELCKDKEYHVILLDHMMPEMDGIETLNNLKNGEVLNSHTPTVALTANVVESIDNFYIRAGFDALLTKPINVDEMEKLLSTLLPEYLLE